MQCVDWWCLCQAVSRPTGACNVQAGSSWPHQLPWLSRVRDESLTIGCSLCFAVPVDMIQCTTPADDTSWGWKTYPGSGIVLKGAAVMERAAAVPASKMPKAQTPCTGLSPRQCWIWSLFGQLEGTGIFRSICLVHLWPAAAAAWKYRCYSSILLATNM